jgi:hypothetical protein
MSCDRQHDCSFAAAAFSQRASGIVVDFAAYLRER